MEYTDIWVDYFCVLPGLFKKSPETLCGESEISAGEGTVHVLVPKEEISSWTAEGLPNLYLSGMWTEDPYSEGKRKDHGKMSEMFHRV